MLLEQIKIEREFLITESGEVSDERFVTHDGEKVYWEVSPASWMHHGYGLQIKLSLKPHSSNAASEFANDKSVKDLVDMPRAKIDKLGREFAQKWVTANGTKPLHDAQTRWDKIDAEYREQSKKDEAKHKVKQAKLDAKYKSQGFTHRLDGWLHLNGDDRQIQAYFKGAPGKADIANVMKRSAVKTDYKLTTL